MMQKKFIIILAILMSFVQPGCAGGFFRERIKQKIVSKLDAEPAPEASTDTKTKIEKPGDYNFVFSFDGRDRYYRVHVPHGYNSKNATPLVLSFHGGGGDMMVQSSEEHYHINSKSDQAGFIVVYPNGFSPFKSGRLATWNAGKCCGGARDEKMNDVGFVKDVLKKVST